MSVRTATISEEMRKARLASLTYSALTILLCLARPGEEVKFIGLDVKIPTVSAAILLLLVSAFYACGFYVETRRAIRRIDTTSPKTHEAAFHDFIEQSRQGISGALVVQHTRAQEFRNTLANITENTRDRLNGISEQVGRIVSSMEMAQPPHQIFNWQADSIEAVKDAYQSLANMRQHELSLHGRQLQNFFTQNSDALNSSNFDAGIDASLRYLEQGSEETSLLLKEINENVLRQSQAVLDYSRALEKADYISYRIYDLMPPYFMIAAATGAAVYRFIISPAP